MALAVDLEGSNSRRFWTSEDNVFSRRSFEIQREHDDEEALKWAALEKLPTYDRVRKAILKKVIDDSGDVALNEIDVANFSLDDRNELIERILKVIDEDNERLLQKLRDRIDKVGIELPRIEVRFENLKVEASVRVGSRALPSVWNFTRNGIESILNMLHLVPPNKKTLHILKDVSGIIKPSRMTLLLGPPASGKTTLLLALADKLNRDLKVSGRITYNGHDFSEFVAQRTSAYISQRDVHTGEMTVRETLDFSGRCQGVGTSYEILMELSRREKLAGIKPDPDIDVFMKATAIAGQETSLVTDYVMKILGLDICADTIVGDNMRRGISGGQKKRVTTGEMIVGPAKALFMDEISTGLDSSTTYQIVKCLRQSVHVMDGTMVISLLQPAPETFELFDDLILLSEGEIVYQGPRQLVLDFFNLMGFKCPERKGVADFLQEVISKKDQEQYWADKTQTYRYVTVTEFANAFKSFHVGERLEEELATPFDRSRNHPAALTTTKYALSSLELFKACLTREWLLTKRNSFVYVFKTAQVVVTAFITMTLFFRTEMHTDTVSDGSVYMGALFYALVHIMFNGLAEMSMMLSRLPVFYKQRNLLFYPAWAYSLPIFVVRVPLSLLEAGAWVCVTYYVIGFAPSAGRFFRQFIVLFLVHQMALSLFRLIAGVGRSKVIARSFGSSALLVVFVLGGFIISRKNIPKWWIWGYWISPLTYGQNSIAVNEFLADRWQKPDPDDNTTTIGKAVLVARGMFPDGYWYWLGVGGLIGFVILFNVLFTLSLALLDPLGKPQATMKEEAVHENGIFKKSQGNPYARKPLNMTIYLRKSLSRSKKCFASDAAANVPVSELGVSNIYGSNRLASSTDGSQSQPIRKGMVLPFQRLSLTFDNINYYVDMPAEMKQQGITEDRLQLLKSVSGFFTPGVLTALVGVSGAGKTTLMDVLAGRKTGGYIEGNITISGYPKNQDTFARISGYCEQNDIHSPCLTVQESIIYSAWLRLSENIDNGTKKMFVEEVMELVELASLRSALVGIPGETGLSTEQRKRLTIAVELVANPSIIFMDEPTSGLDARAAAVVMRTVRNTVDTGRTVVCTIHQPSIDIFEAFDELLLMKRGGQVIYAGPLGRHSCKLIEYFEAIDGVPRIMEGYNPATWMLEVSSASAEKTLGVDFAEIYRNSSLYEHNKVLIEKLSIPAPDTVDLHFPTKYSQSFVFQWLACLWKQNISYWRNPEYTAIRFYYTLACSLIFGTIFWRRGSERSTAGDISNVMGSIFASVLFLGVGNANSVQPIISIERTVFYRERAAGMYSALPYALAQAGIEIPYIICQSLAYGVIVYAMVNFQWTAAKFFWFLYFMFMTLLFFTYYGMMAIALTPNDHIATIVSSASLGLWNLFSGFLIPRPRMPAWWRWYIWADPVQWTMYGLVVSQLGDVDDEYIRVRGPSEPETVSNYLKTTYGFHHGFLGGAAGMEVAFVLLFGFVFAFAIRHLNFQKR